MCKVSLPFSDMACGCKQVEYSVDAVHESGTMARMLPAAAYGCPYPLVNGRTQTCTSHKALAAQCKRPICMSAQRAALGRRSLPVLPLHPIM